MSVLNNFNKLTMKDLKYPSSEVDDICASSCKSYLMTWTWYVRVRSSTPSKYLTSSEGSESVFRRAKKVPSSIARIYTLQFNQRGIVLKSSYEPSWAPWNEALSTTSKLQP